MVQLQPKQLKKYLRGCDSDIILILCEFLHNVSLVHVRVKLRDLKSYNHITNNNRSRTYQLIVKFCSIHLS